MEITKLNAQIREKISSGLNILRENGLIPAVLYGPGIEPQNIAVEYSTFLKVYEKAGESSLVDLKIGDNEPVKVLIKDVQKDPISDNPIHIDFRQIKMTEKLEADIELEFVGESRAVKEMSGILVKNMDTIAVRCLPSALVSQIEVDLSALQEFGDIIRAKDIKLLEGMELMEDAEASIVTVTEPRSEKEIEETEKPVEESVENVEVEGEKEKTEEEKVGAENLQPEEQNEG